MAWAGKWHSESPYLGRNDAERALEKAFYIWQAYHPPYVWGGGSLSGIDCSHFVCACYFGPYTGSDSCKGYSYWTTASMVQGPLKHYYFEQLSYSRSRRKAGDILVYNGHTGICIDGYQNPTYKLKYDQGVIQSYGSHGVGVLPNGGSWTHIYRPKEGLGVYISKITPTY